MIGKASEIKTQFVDASFISELQRDINGYLRSHPNWEIIDIRYQNIVDQTSENKIYHVALIIYKEGETA